MDGVSLPRHWLLRALELEPARGEDTVKAGRDAIRAFLEAAEEAWPADRDPGEATSQLEEYALRLRRARPGDAALTAALSEAMSAIPRGREALLETLRGALLRAESSDEALVAAGSALFRPGSRVLTLGWHRLIEDLLLRCGDRLEGATVSEGRPGCEGARLAERLGAQAIPVRLITEAALELVVGECDVAVAAAERVLPDGRAVAAVGTAVLARVCQSGKVPFYVLAATDRWVPEGADLAHFAWERRPPGEVLSQAPRGVQVLNVAYDLTEASLIAGYVTENGVLPASSLSGAMQQAA